jgi:hypothetical protein
VASLLSARMVSRLVGRIHAFNISSRVATDNSVRWYILHKMSQDIFNKEENY